MEQANNNASCYEFEIPPENHSLPPIAGMISGLKYKVTEKLRRDRILFRHLFEKILPMSISDRYIFFTGT